MKTWNSFAGWQKPNRQRILVMLMAGALLLGSSPAWSDPRPERDLHESRREFDERGRRWKALPPEQKDLLRQRVEQFKRMPPEQQERIREEYRRFRQLPPEDRQSIKERWRQMTPRERRELKERWRNLPPAERRSIREQLNEQQHDRQRRD